MRATVAAGTAGATLKSRRGAVLLRPLRMETDRAQQDCAPTVPRTALRYFAAEGPDGFSSRSIGLIFVGAGRRACSFMKAMSRSLKSFAGS